MRPEQPQPYTMTGPCLTTGILEYFLTLRKKIRNTYSDENFINAYSEGAAECLPTKQRAKSRVAWETLAVRKKRADVKTASQCNRRNPTYINAKKFKKAQNELTNVKEQICSICS